MTSLEAAVNLVFQSGQNEVIGLPVLGAYSPTAPDNCPKNEKMITQTAELILKTGKIWQNSTRTDLLGLMATGEKKYLDVAAKAIKADESRARAIDCLGGDCPPAMTVPHAGLPGSIVRDSKEPFQVRMAAAAVLGSKPFQEAKAGYPYYNDVLQLVYEPRTEQDPFNLIDVKLAEALDGIYAEPLKENFVTDKALFYKTAGRFLDHKRHQGRAVGTSMLRGMPAEDFHLVSDKLMYVIGNTDPTYQSYHAVHEVVAPGVEVLDLLAETTMSPSWKWGFKSKMVYRALPLYGGNAKPYILRFEEHPNIAKGKNVDPWLKLVISIEADANPKKLISLEEARKARHLN